MKCATFSNLLPQQQILCKNEFMLSIIIYKNSITFNRYIPLIFGNTPYLNFPLIDLVFPLIPNTLAVSDGVIA